MDETPFPQYKKGVPRAGLDDYSQVIVALIIAAFPYFLLNMLLGEWDFKAAVGLAVAFVTYKWVAVPTLRSLYNRVPPNYFGHYLNVVKYRGGLRARPDPDPLPFKVN